MRKKIKKELNLEYNSHLTSKKLNEIINSKFNELSEMMKNLKEFINTLIIK